MINKISLFLIFVIFPVQIYGSANFNGSIYFSVSSGVSFAGKSAGTISIWYKPSVTTPANNTAVYYESGGTTGFTRFGIYNNASGNLQGIVRNTTTGDVGSSVAVTETAPFTAGTWYHLCLTYDGTTVILYRDGVERARATTSGSFTSTTTVDPFGLGAYTGVTGPFIITGYIDDFRLYDRALSANEVASLGKSRKRLIITDGLMVWFPINEGVPGLTICDACSVDRSNKGNTLSRTGDPMTYGSLTTLDYR